jgi:hypothetical protein
MHNIKADYMTFSIDHIIVRIDNEVNGIRLTTETENLLLQNQTLIETKSVIEKNYKIVKEYFQDKMSDTITETDLENFSLKIVLHFFYMYNLWRTMYQREKNRDLTFLDKDFKHPYTSYHIIDYFKNKYPDNYADKCETILEMTSEQFKEYLISKEQFENR